MTRYIIVDPTYQWVATCKLYRTLQEAILVKQDAVETYGLTTSWIICKVSDIKELKVQGQ